jgi:hypothetical protein
MEIMERSSKTCRVCLSFEDANNFDEIVDDFHSKAIDVFLISGVKVHKNIV